MNRAIVLVLDSFGLGACDDANQFGDVGADTLGSIATYFEKNNIAFDLPNLNALGLGEAYKISTGRNYAGYKTQMIRGAYGVAAEKSAGKDTPSGHWEMMGLPVIKDWGYFENKTNCFPTKLIEEICREAGIRGILGNKHSSGTKIIEEFFEIHKKSKLPICYTSGDSVFQIAAHEKYFGLEKLYRLCEIAFEQIQPYHIARVIARPFEGESAQDFRRTNNRKDYAVPPPADTLLDKLIANKGRVISIGKIADIFAHRGISRSVKASGLDELFDKTLNEIMIASAQSLIFTNFVDFDQNFGHRRDPKGYGEALMAFDQMLPELLQRLQQNDLLIITADHGCDPTFKGSDHTRENVPVICYYKNDDVNKPISVNLGKRDTFADIGQTLSDYFNLDSMDYGKSFLMELTGYDSTAKK